jgi:hypothetical protein
MKLFVATEPARGTCSPIWWFLKFFSSNMLLKIFCFTYLCMADTFVSLNTTLRVGTLMSHGLIKLNQCIMYKACNRPQTANLTLYIWHWILNIYEPWRNMEILVTLTAIENKILDTQHHIYIYETAILVFICNIWEITYREIRANHMSKAINVHTVNFLCSSMKNW